MKKTLIVGAGEAGTVITNVLKKELDKRGAFGYSYKTLNSSKNDSDKATEININNRILLENIGGMAKEMEKVAEVMEEQGRKVLTNVFSEVMSGEIDRVLLISSLGGGTGCGITTNIIQTFSKKMINNGVKLRVLLVAPFKNEDMTSKRNTVAAIKVLQDNKIATRVISNSNFMNYEGRTQQEIHDLINKYIVDTEVILQEAESFETIGLNTDIAELDKILYTPGYTFITKIKLSTKDKDKNQRDVIQKLQNSLDMEIKKDFHKYSIMIVAAFPDVTSKLNLDEINENLGVTGNSRFKTFVKPENDSFILIATSGSSFPEKIEEMYDEVIKHKKTISESNQKKLNINLNNLFEGEEDEAEEMPETQFSFKKEKKKIEVDLDSWF